MTTESKLIDVNTVTANEGDIIFLKFDPEMHNDDLQYAMKTLREAFPDNEVLGICNNMDVLAQNPKEAIEMLEKMIAHIKIVGGTSADKKIIV